MPVVHAGMATKPFVMCTFAPDFICADSVTLDGIWYYDTSMYRDRLMVTYVVGGVGEPISDCVFSVQFPIALWPASFQYVITARLFAI